MPCREMAPAGQAEGRGGSEADEAGLVGAKSLRNGEGTLVMLDEGISSESGVCVRHKALLARLRSQVDRA